jgi:hypothetical protein
MFADFVVAGDSLTPSQESLLWLLLLLLLLLLTSSPSLSLGTTEREALRSCRSLLCFCAEHAISIFAKKSATERGKLGGPSGKFRFVAL